MIILPIANFMKKGMAAHAHVDGVLYVFKGELIRNCPILHSGLGNKRERELYRNNISLWPAWL